MNYENLPDFKSITSDTIHSELLILLSAANDTLAVLGKQLGKATWKSFGEPLEILLLEIDHFWSPISQLNSVTSEEKFREEYEKCQSLLSEFYANFGQNEAIFQSLCFVKEDLEKSDLASSEAHRAIEIRLSDFELSGIALPSEKRQRFKDIEIELSKLATTFGNNVVDATDSWFYHTDSSEMLDGLPEFFIEKCESLAQKKCLEGYCVPIDGASYMIAMSKAESPKLREVLYEAFCTRASDEFPGDKKYNNDTNIEKILSLKNEQATLLAFDSYADFSLARKMAPNKNAVESFLRDLSDRSYEQGKKEFEALKEFATDLGMDTIKPSDLAYLGEKKKSYDYGVSQEELRQYFPLPKVLNGLFDLLQTLFSVEIKKHPCTNTWHESVHLFQVFQNKKHIASFYTDLFGREGKRGGAWMGSCRQACNIDGKIQIPVAFLVCNFSSAADGEVAYLTHNEVLTLFHEFGHGFHHMLTRVSVPSVSGINNVQWDAVELPSQFLENYCWQSEVLNNISCHKETGETISDELIEKIIEGKNFNSALAMLRQIEFSLFDWLIHQAENPLCCSEVQSLMNEVRKDVSIVPVPSFNRFQNAFSHIFAGGYAAGYYSYKWAEVLSADVFSTFEEQGVFSSKVGSNYQKAILEKGATKDASILFENFMGRGPDISALLKHSGIVYEQA